ncbi:hypothetical protein MLD38_022688 [Melastoma candidum]|uniref:Uncharacterized protein n=1 Tax=Melastoma candidum TaxID=119954 RepID=A0ACB9QT93_9MYRT|nr:hypothetical protein MLD38_022688 [Melastoma candidum]
MDDALSDELLHEIFRRLPPSPDVSLVSKRWLSVHRQSLTSISLRSPPSLPAFSSLLSNLPSLSSVSVSVSVTASPLSPLLFLSLSHLCPNLRSLSFLPFPLSPPSLSLLSRNCPRLSSLSLSLSRPLRFPWLLLFPSLRELSVLASDYPSYDLCDDSAESCHDDVVPGDDARELWLESLSLTAIKGDDFGVCWLWRRCGKLRRLALNSCEGIGTDADQEDGYFWFLRCLKGIKEVEIRICRSIVDEILSKLAENCERLVSLLLHDGGGDGALLRFLNIHRCNLESIDFRLPMDLSNDHLLALSSNCGSLVSFKVQSCFLGTSEGLKSLAAATGDRLRELQLIHCDVVDRERGLLPALGQQLRHLTNLDLSCNVMLEDKGLVSMLASCDQLVDLGLRGCRSLTSNAVIAVSRSCVRIKYVDIADCPNIEEKAVEFLVSNSPWLRRVTVEKSKVSNVTKRTASRKSIEIVG